MGGTNPGERIADILVKASDSLGASILAYAAALAAVGAIVMAMLELIKALLRLRYWFHRMQVDKWVGADADRRKEFIALTTGGYASESALFDQPIEKLMAQVHRPGRTWRWISPTATRSSTLS